MRRLAFVALMVVGCGSSGSGSDGNAPVDPRIQVPDLRPEPADANGFQLILPKVTNIEVGKDYEYCTWTDKILTEDIDIKGAKGFQSKTGHHVILFYTMHPEPPGTTRICNEEDMGKMRFAMGTAGEGVANEMPGDLVMHIPKGAQLIANHHYLNPYDKTYEAQSAINVRLADKGAKVTRSGAVAWVDTALLVPPGRSSFELKCKMTREMKLWVMQPHMHRWGEHITVDRVRADNTGERLFDVKWAEEYTFHPPEIRRDPGDPFVLNVGDQIKVKCDYNNTAGKDLPFGLEMCVAFGQTVNAELANNIACDKGEWVEF
jgi:hypothetical protein